MFQRLHPALRHHIVNTLQWTSLRPVQEQSIAEILDGKNTVILAPTAGGKTEAAFFPAFTQCLHEQWDGVSILYLSPIRALLNNQAQRIHHLSELVGLRSALWHGDVSATQRRKIMDDPPNILLTTPESIEAMCISRNRDHRTFLQDVRLVIIDEIHAFAGDDRGWHLLAILERIQRISGNDIQRVGLSATVGNPKGIAQWMIGSSQRPATVVDPPRSTSTTPNVTIDWVGTLENAAKIIITLYPHTKRLVFCDSRAQCEMLGTLVRAYGERVFVSHSSLSANERRRTEREFAEGGAGVIIATSALELGIDIGDLDHVIQIDAPFSVASFLQRMGRTGRRADSTANCLFLTITDVGFWRAVAIVDQWKRGIIEDANAPPIPYHISAQQMLAEALAAPGMSVQKHRSIAGDFAALWSGTPEVLDDLYSYFLSEELLFTDGGHLSLGVNAERELGQKNFLNLVSVFTSPPTFQAYYGTRPIGEVDRRLLEADEEGTPQEEHAQIILLAGRTWRIRGVNWARQRVWIVPWESTHGKAAWIGQGQGLGPDLAYSHYLAFRGSKRGQEHWSERAQSKLTQLAQEFWYMHKGQYVALTDDEYTLLFTFAGTAANCWIAGMLRDGGWEKVQANGLMVRAMAPASILGQTTASDALTYLRACAAQNKEPYVDSKNHDYRALKFGELLPPPIGFATYRARRYDAIAAHHALQQEWALIRLDDDAEK